jgi:hypothetical protein
MQGSPIQGVGTVRQNIRGERGGIIIIGRDRFFRILFFSYL